MTNSQNPRKEFAPGEEHILLGVTGGIATGKSTVTRMLEEMGAAVIDFDILSREVVAPGSPAWRQIVDYFGRDVLQKDETLDRKKVAEIVFHRPEKRKMLEEFTHPRIFEKYLRTVEAVLAKNHRAVIQVVIPLLIEAGLQSFCHKILLVYTPESVQIERLMQRDGISREMAESILRAQMPIEEKKRYADYIADNSGPLGDIRDQLSGIWAELKRLQDRLPAAGSAPE
jgi:dephospho-CoA kinase